MPFDFIALSSQLLYSEFRFTLATLPVASVQVHTIMYLGIGSGFFRIVIVAIIFLGAFLFIGFFSLAIVSLVPSCAVVQVFFCRRLTQRVSSPAPHHRHNQQQQQQDFFFIWLRCKVKCLNLQISKTNTSEDNRWRGYRVLVDCVVVMFRVVWVYGAGRIRKLSAQRHEQTFDVWPVPNIFPI